MPKIRLRGGASESLQILNNKDKTGWLEDWHTPKNRSLGCFPHSSRILFTAQPGRGKTLTLKNLFLQHQKSKRKFKHLVVCTASKDSDEYADLEPDSIHDEIPPLDCFNGKQGKTCVVIDDMEFAASNTEQIRRLTTLFRYVSSHKNTSVYCAYQSFFNVPQIIRKCCNVFVLWKPNALQEMTVIANRCGIEPQVVKDIFKYICDDFYDSLCIDMTKDSPAKLRKNIYQPIDMED
jgi:hypothetical protein